MRWFQKCFVVAEVRQYKLFSFWVFFTNISYIRNLIGQFKRDNMHNSKIKCFLFSDWKLGIRVRRLHGIQGLLESWHEEVPRIHVGEHQIWWTQGGIHIWRTRHAWDHLRGPWCQFLLCSGRTALYTMCSFPVTGRDKKDACQESPIWVSTP